MLSEIKHPIQSTFLVKNKELLAQQIQESFKEGKTIDCFKYLWECYQQYPYFLPIQPFIRHFRKELTVMKMRNRIAE